MSGRPVLPDVGVIALVPDRWRDVWQPRHQTIFRLSDYFHVVWLDPQDHWRKLAAADLSDRYRVGPPDPLRIMEMPWWQGRFRRVEWWGRLMWRMRLVRARRYLVRKGCQKIVLYVWRPELGEALDQVSHDVSCYHIDDEYSFSRLESPTSPRELRLLEAADRVFIHSKALMDKKGAVNPNTLMSPNGVDFAAYAEPVSEPPDLASIPRPRVLYSGRLKQQMDWDLLIRLASSAPQWQFVFVGPSTGHKDTLAPMAQLQGMPNVHLLGGRHPQALPAYVQHSDACMMPYVLNDYTRYIYPLKLHEYLAAGKPVVSSAIGAVLSFTDVVEVAAGFDEWQDKLAWALSEEAHSPALVAARQAVARCYDWAELTYKIASAMAAALGSGHLSRLEQAVTQEKAGGAPAR